MVSCTILVSEYIELSKPIFLFVLCNHVIKDFHKRYCLIMLLSKKLEKHFMCGVFISPFPEYIFQIA